MTYAVLQTLFLAGYLPGKVIIQIMDGEEYESSSDQSTDEELCQQLRDAGLKLGRKRRKQSFRESEKRSKLGKMLL